MVIESLIGRELDGHLFNEQAALADCGELAGRDALASEQQRRQVGGGGLGEQAAGDHAEERDGGACVLAGVANQVRLPG